MKVIIAGGRDFKDYSLLKRVVNGLRKKLDEDIVIISGAAAGADKLGERYASEYNIKVLQFPADWDTHGKAAGPIRNKQMAEAGDALIAFWDGESRGTKSMISLAKKHSLKIKVVRY